MQAWLEAETAPPMPEDAPREAQVHPPSPSQRDVEDWSREAWLKAETAPPMQDAWRGEARSDAESLHLWRRASWQRIQVLGMCLYIHEETRAVVEDLPADEPFFESF